MLQIVVPMAGLGRRFKDVGYQTPKPFIETLGRPMIERVVDNLARGLSVVADFLLIYRQEHVDYVSKIVPPDGVTMRSAAVNHDTRGPVDTILCALGEIDFQAPLLISTCDQLIDVCIDEFVTKGLSHDGALITFPIRNDDRWSYVETRGGYTCRVVEKEPISDEATCGQYLFKSASHFVQSARSAMDRNETVHGEYYIAPLYNSIIEKGGRVATYRIEGNAMMPLGTPSDFERFVENGYLPRFENNGRWSYQESATDRMTE